MDDEFAFSLHSTREEWEEQQREFEEWNRHWEALEQERERLGVKNPVDAYIPPEEIWTRSFIAPESEKAPFALRLFAVGTLLSELTCDLKEPTEDREQLDRLSRVWGNLREVVGATDAEPQASLIEPVLDQFCQTLHEVTTARPDLEPKCSDLISRLRRFTRTTSEDVET